MTLGRPGVYITEALLPAPVATVGTANAAGAAIGAFGQGPTGLTLVTSWYDFVQKFGNFNVAYPATFGVNQFFVNGGSELYVKRVVGAGATAAGAFIRDVDDTVNMATVTATNIGSIGNNFRIRVSQTAGSTTLFNLTVTKESVVGGTSTSITDDITLERFEGLTFADTTATNFVETVVNALSSYVNITVDDVTKVPAVQSTTTVIPLTGGADGTAPDDSAYNAVIATDGSSEFDSVNRPLVMFAPELYSALKAAYSNTAAAKLASVHGQMLAWAASGNGYAVIDSAPSLSVDDVLDYADSLTSKSSQGAVYYPNYYINDPLNSARGILRKVGPAAAVTGIYLSTDKQVGPFKAPAGMQAGISGAISLEKAFTSGDLDKLNTGADGSKPAVNAIRNIPGAGITIMGARTLLQDGTANKYVNMRRSLIYIKKRLDDLTSFAVFQNNDYKLWAQLTTVVTAFLNEYRNQGGLRGNSPAQSFYVKVDSQNNTAQTVALGEVHIEIGVALQYPSEFVVINLSQITGQ